MTSCSASVSFIMTGASSLVSPNGTFELGWLVRSRGQNGVDLKLLARTAERKYRGRDEGEFLARTGNDQMINFVRPLSKCDSSWANPWFYGVSIRNQRCPFWAEKSIDFRHLC
jgi:hypothetical protein